MKACPIQLDSFLTRYLSAIEFGFDRQNYPGSSGDEREPRNRLLVERVLPEERGRITHHTEKQFDDFVSYFERNKALRFIPYEDYVDKYNLVAARENMRDGIELRDPYRPFDFETYLYVEVLNIDFVRKFRKDYCFVLSAESQEALVGDNSRELYINLAGQVFHGKERREVSIGMDFGSGYHQILIGIYLATHGCGRASVSAVNKILKRDFGTTYTQKQMQNAINNSIRKFIDFHLSGGGYLFDWKNDDVVLNNPKFEKHKETSIG